MTYKLLLADDSVTIQRVIELTFAALDVEVISVSDGEQAIARIPLERPDIVLADIGMPKRNGYEVAVFVKGRPDLKHIPVLLLAGAFEPVDAEKADQAECDGILVKPFEPQQVITRVRELLGEPNLQPAAGAPAGQIDTPADRSVSSRTLEFPRRDEPMAEAERFDRDSRPMEEPLTPETAHDESLDDYFDRLDAAFATADITSIANPPNAARDEVPGDDDMAIPTLEEVLAAASGSKVTPPRLDPPPAAAPSAPVSEPTRNAPLKPTLNPPPNAAADAAPNRSVIADAFTLLLAAEQGEPGARPVWRPTAPGQPEVTDAMADEVTRRVLERIGPDAVRKVVGEVVSEVAERLVREEIARIRKSGKP